LLIPSSVAPKLASGARVEEVKALIQRELYEALNELERMNGDDSMAVDAALEGAA
jgi:hypothetical protein